MCERESERVCVCKRDTDKYRESEKVTETVRKCERPRECVCVCERERERGLLQITNFLAPFNPNRTRVLCYSIV